MSNKIRKLEFGKPDHLPDSRDMRVLVAAVNLAIDRINELELREVNAWKHLEDLEAKFDRHTHDFGDFTAPPTPTEGEK